MLNFVILLIRFFRLQTTVVVYNEDVMWEKVGFKRGTKEGMVNIKKLFEPADMTVGTPWKSIAVFSIPMLIGNIAQQLYNTVDSIVVGHYVGDNALAAVGSASPLLNMLLV